MAREPATSLCGPRHRFHSANFLHNSGGSRARAMDRSGQGGMADIFARRLSNSLLVALEFISITTWTSVMTSLRFLFQSRTIDAKGISTPSLLCGHQKQTVGNTQPVRNGNGLAAMPKGFWIAGRFGDNWRLVGKHLWPRLPERLAQQVQGLGKELRV